MNTIDGLDEKQRQAFDDLLKHLLDVQDEFENSIQKIQSDPETGWENLRRSRTSEFARAIEELDGLVPKEEVYLKLAEMMFREDDETLPLGFRG